MPTVTFNFNEEGFNVSAQVGDIMYWVQTTDTGNLTLDNTYQAPNTAQIEKVGEITNISMIPGADVMVSCEVVDWTNIPGGVSYAGVDWPNVFFMFSKDNSANLSSVLGYYAKVKFKNLSTNKAELFSVGSNIRMSSK